MQVYLYANSSAYEWLCRDLVRKSLWPFDCGTVKAKPNAHRVVFVVLLEEMAVSLMSFQIADPGILLQAFRLSVAA